MGYVKYVGRVGALAVALGIGTALTGGVGVGYAEGAGASKYSQGEVSRELGGVGRPRSALGLAGSVAARVWEAANKLPKWMASGLCVQIARSADW